MSLTGPDRPDRPESAAFMPVFAATYRADMVRRPPHGGAWMVGAGAFAGRVAPLVGCVVGNPVHPATFGPAWRTADVIGLAAAAYEGRAFGRLSVLADALEDAGCHDEAVLAHCRGGPHARGCWVVDCLLGKE